MAGNPEIKGLTNDSRSVQRGALFVAVPGTQFDGHMYVDEAIRRGAVAVAHCKPLSTYQGGVSYIETVDSRSFLSAASAHFFGNPSKKIKVIGVTGTDGKSTTAGFIHQLLEMSGVESGLMSTVYFKSGREMERNPSRLSTPEAPAIHKALADMAHGSVSYAVVEATSHGLSAKTARLKDVIFHAGVLTKVTHEHLEFHGSFEQYRNDKANLVRQIHNKGICVLNRDDPSCDFFSAESGCSSFTYGLESDKANLKSDSIEQEEFTTRFLLKWTNKTRDCFLRMPGRFNVANALAACLTVSQCLGIDPVELSSLFPRLKLPLGRLAAIDCGQPYRVIVDFAHTPESFRELFASMRPSTNGKLIVVFGSAGDRDTGKRFLQGKIASELADIVVLTDEDPRSEDPMAILEDIAEGVTKQVRGSALFLEPDRKTAIRKALQIAEKGDTVLCLGKGHERSIQYADGAVAWNEENAVKEILGDLDG